MPPFAKLSPGKALRGLLTPLPGLTEPGPGSPMLYLLFASSGSKYADGGDCGLPCVPKGMGLANPPVQFSIAETFHPEERLWLPCQDMNKIEIEDYSTPTPTKDYDSLQYYLLRRQRQGKV